MKITKKIASLLLACIMVVCCAAPVFASELAPSVLRFDENGKFKIMIFADIQDDETVEETTLQFMSESLDKYNPDLVVYLGDNTVARGEDNQRIAIEAITEPCISRKIPFALVFGNHDQEQGVDKETLLAMYKSIGKELCLTWDAGDIYGCGNSNLLIMSSKNLLKPAFNLWFIDSGSTLYDENGDRKGYDYVREDQIKWYEDTAEHLKVFNDGKIIPAILFQHIIVPEVYEAMYPSLPVSIGSTYKGVSYLPIPTMSKFTGMAFEDPCPSYTSVGQFDSLVKTGDVIASFYGHDHLNDFSTSYKGIDMTAVPSVGCHSYSNDMTRGIGLITLDENDLTTYDYETIHIYDMATAEGSQIGNVDGGQSQFYYTFIKFMRNALDTVFNVFRTVPAVK